MEETKKLLVANLDAYWRREPSFQNLVLPIQALRNCKLCAGFGSNEDHRRKHAIRAYKEVRKEATEHTERMTDLIRIQEFFLNERSKISLWYVSTHKDYHHAISDVVRYWNRYTTLTFDFAVDLYRALYAIFKKRKVRRDSAETVALTGLKEWVISVEKLDSIFSIMKMIDRASILSKASKESYLRDIRSCLLGNWRLDILSAGEIIGEYVGYDLKTKQARYVKIPKYHLKLDFIQLITRLFQNLDEFIREDSSDEFLCCLQMLES